jgi:hypothetical protein
MSAEWLGHDNLCPVQWGEFCDCADEVDLFVELDLMADEEDDE